MIVDTTAYMLSFIKILLCFLVRDFLIPLLVWNKYLKKRNYSYRFWFCVITQAALQINLVLLLGFLDICNRFTIIGCNILIYGLIIWNYSDKKFFRYYREAVEVLWNAYKEERLFRFIAQKIREWSKARFKAVCRWYVWRYIYKNWIEISLLGALLIYNIWFLTYNVMRYHCYQFSDIPVHQSWIYELEQGTLFSDGIYPFGMHAMVYLIRIIFRINLREIMLYAGAYQTILLMLSLYLLAKLIFKAKYTPVTVVIIISFMLNQSRYSASLPQEAGMYAVIGIAYFMFRYLHTKKDKIDIESDSRLRRLFRIKAYINRRYINAESILLMLCVALVIAYHFYTAIAAIFLVIAVGLAYIPKIFKKQYFIPLMFCGITGAVIAVLPMAACLAKGIPFQESTEWATSVIAGEEWKGSDVEYQVKLAEAQGRNYEDTDDSGTTKKNEKTAVDYSGMTPFEIVKYYYEAIYNFGLLAMFGGSATLLMFRCMFLGVLCGIILLLNKKTRNIGHDYVAMIINMLLLCSIGAAQALGLVELIAAARASTFAEPFVGFIYMLPIDFAFRILGIWKKKYYQLLLNYTSLMVFAAVACMIIKMGWYHAFFDVNQAYYNESEYLLRHIRQSYENKTYTIVSPTEEYYDVIDYGYHTQLSKFMDMVNGNQQEFVFPTKYVFFFIEKRVLQDYTYGSVAVGLKYAAKNLIYLENSQDYYFQRAIIESQAYYWAQKLQQVYPLNFRVYYEDDIYISYILEQNIYSPYNLQIDYLSDYADEINENSWNLKD